MFEVVTWYLIIFSSASPAVVQFDTHLKCDVAKQEIRKEYARYGQRGPMMTCVYGTGPEPNAQQKDMP